MINVSKKQFRWFILFIIITGIITAVALISFRSREKNGYVPDNSGYVYSPIKTKNKLQKAYDAVYSEYGYSSCYRIGSDYSYISVDTNPNDIDDYFSWETYNILLAFNKTLGISEYVGEKMSKTTALQGRQEEISNGVKISWTYHPDKGLEVIYSLV